MSNIEIAKNIKLDVNQFFTQIGTLLKNAPIVRMAIEKRKYKIGLIEAQTDNDKELIKEGKAHFCFKTNQLLKLEELNPIALSDATREIRKENNSDMIWDTVFEELKNKKLEDFGNTENREYFNEEFMPYWEEESYRMNREDLRHLWAKILVKEMEYPYSVSIRTMEFVKTLSKRDANIFNKIIPYVINNNTLPHMYNVINALDIQHLEHLGLLLGNRSYNIKEGLRSFGKYALSSEKEFTFDCYSLSDIAKELYSIADVGECDFEKLEEVFDYSHKILVRYKIRFHKKIHENSYLTEPFKVYEKKVQKSGLANKYEDLPKLSLEPNV